MEKKRYFYVLLIFFLFLSVTNVIPVHTYGNNPNDPRLYEQWGWLKIYCDVTYANKYRGLNTTIVAVIDTGIDLDHPDLQANIYVNTIELYGVNGLDDDGNGYIDDIHGWNFVDNNNDTSDHDRHGSHCAGIIAADDNTIGVCGVAPDVKILPVKVIEVESGNMNVLAEAINYSRIMGAKVISMSIGTDDVSFPGKIAINNAINLAYAAGIVLVAAAGNDAIHDVSYPASHSNVIAVSATTKSNDLAEYSNWGPEIELTAPGGDSSGIILSTDNKSGYIYLGGTSMACPFVSGVAALLFQWNNSLTPTEVRNRLNSTATDLGTPGDDEYFGAGLVSAAAALGLPESHVYNPIIDWILINLWWMILIGLGFILLIVFSRRKAPSSSSGSTYYPDSPPEYY
ncbi:MAG: S8 family peptidase [Candidatus Helarchaeota archaeon]